MSRIVTSSGITAERFFSAFGAMLSGQTISTKGILLIKNFEGKSLKPYLDDDKSTPNRVEYSIGYGHQIKPGEEYLMSGITDQKAEDLLISDLSAAINAVNNTITVPLTQDQFDSLVSYAFNIGTGAFKTGTLAKLINSKASKKELATWWTSHYITAAGHPSAALQTRRAEEFKVYTAGLSPASTTGKILLLSLAALAMLGASKKNRAA